MRVIVSIVAGLLLVGCPVIDKDLAELKTIDTAAGLVDEDEDGFGVNTDCDDNNADVNPDALEACDGVDNDCNGEVDDGEAVDAPTWYPDTDGDGFGNLNGGVIACEAPSGTIADGLDCDDTDSAVHPDATEICLTSWDDNCDGNTNDDGAIACAVYYFDADGDGHGSGSSRCLCEFEDEYSAASAGDCDDTDTSLFPSAVELCDGLDNDCDGVTPAAEIDGDTDGFAGCALDSGGWDGDPAVTGWEDCDDTDDTVHPGAAELCDGADNDCDSVTPAIETDDDADAFVECALDAGGWDGPATAEGGDCDDADLHTFPGAAETESPTACMTDADEDGWGETTPASGVDIGTDCDDASIYTFPGAAENESATDCMRDVDEDGWGEATTTAPVVAGTDCDDADAVSNRDDADSDGTSSCDGDCDDTDAALNQDDGDTDGHSTCGGDCDDGDGATYPGAAALDSTTLCMTDGDGDGWGDVAPATGVDAGTDCDDTDASLNQDDGDTDGYSTCSGDCNDADAQASPVASEVCDGTDNDCDGTTDENDAVDAPTWYADSDQDGYGNAADSMVQCAPPNGYVSDSNDCDDADATSYPSATEVCDTIDNDCDGTADNGADADNDGHDNLCDADCDDGDSTTYPGATDTCEDGIDQNCDGADTGCRLDGDMALADADSILRFVGADIYSMAAPGDVDGDGRDDLLVLQDSGSYSNAYLVTGPIETETYIESASTRFTSTGSEYGFGPYIGDDIPSSIVGDANGDGVGDLLLGESSAMEVGGSGSGWHAGAAYLFLGPFDATEPASNADVVFEGDPSIVNSGGYPIGSGVGLGDVTGDGVDDVILAGTDFTTGWQRVAIREGPVAPGTYSFVDIVFGLSASSSSTQVYPSSGIIGGYDLNADGVDDLVVGQHIFYGPLSGITDFEDYDTYLYDAGYHPEPAGDVSGDGYMDFIQDGDGLFYGPLYGELGDGSLVATFDSFGYVYDIAGVQDMDGDGSGDVAIQVSSDPALVHLFAGPLYGAQTAADAVATIEAPPGTNFGYDYLIGPGDMSGDGFPDLVASHWDGSDNFLYVFFGGDQY